MSEGNKVLALCQDDVKYFLAAHTHIGATNVNYQMEQYVFKRRSDGVHLIDLSKTWEKILLAARAIVAVDHCADVCAIACSSSSGDSKPLGQRAVLKFAKHTGATPIAGRYTPGTFTNQIQQVTISFQAFPGNPFQMSYLPPVELATRLRRDIRDVLHLWNKNPPP